MPSTERAPGQARVPLAAARLWGARLLIIAVVVGAWQWSSESHLVNPLFVGRPTDIAMSFWNGLFVQGTFLADMGVTMLETGISFVLGIAAGIAVGLAFGVSPYLERLTGPLLGALNSVPRIALAPLFILWFGIGIPSKIALAVSLVFFIVLESTVAGIRSVDRDWLVLARTLDASALQVFFRITLPSALPTLFSSLRISAVYSLLGVITAEIIAAQHGLGQLLTSYANSFQTNGVFAVLLLLGLIGGVLAWLMTILERRLTRWS